MAKKAVDVIPARKPEAKVPQSDIVEIDLHAHELLDSTAGMSNGEILNYQLDVFRKTLEEYKSKKDRRLFSFMARAMAFAQSHLARIKI